MDARHRAGHGVSVIAALRPLTEEVIIRAQICGAKGSIEPSPRGANMRLNRLAAVIAAAALLSGLPAAVQAQ